MDSLSARLGLVAQSPMFWLALTSFSCCLSVGSTEEPPPPPKKKKRGGGGKVGRVVDLEGTPPPQKKKGGL